MTQTQRIEACFARLKAEGRKGLVIYTMAGDPDAELSQAVLNGLPAAGADVVELGMPFTDPMADGPAIQLAGQRALAGGQTLVRTLAMVRAFRAQNPSTPLVLMGYYNPIYIYGVDRFIEDALEAGVDGLLIVDLPSEEDAELCLPARAKGLNFIRLATPTTDAKRLPDVLRNASGFIYYVSIAGITGTASATRESVAKQLNSMRPHTTLPLVVGFGIKTPEDVASMAQEADAVVVGSAFVERAAQVKETADLDELFAFVKALAAPLRS